MYEMTAKACSNLVKNCGNRLTTAIICAMLRRMVFEGDTEMSARHMLKNILEMVL